MASSAAPQCRKTIEYARFEQACARWPPPVGGMARHLRRSCMHAWQQPASRSDGRTTMSIAINMEVPAKQTSHVTVATASLIGTAIEWYDFFLYGTAAALIFNKLFFPTFDPMVGTLLAFATYALGFVA